MRTPSPTLAAPLALPCTIADRYELRRRIGIGASSEIFLGWDRELTREVAIKRLRRESELDPSAIAGMRREAQKLAAARVDPMTEIYDIRTSGNDRFLVLRHIAGRSLDKVIAQTGPLAVEVTLQVMGDILEALLEQHRSGRVHHDVAPENVLVDDAGRAVLLDLGDPSDAGHCVGDRVDVLQVGMLMFYAAFGCAPPEDPGELITVTVPGRPACFAAVILSALAPPEERFASVEAMAEAVRLALREVLITEVGIDEIVDAVDAGLAADALFADGAAVDESERATTEMTPLQRTPAPAHVAIGPLPSEAPRMQLVAPALVDRDADAAAADAAEAEPAPRRRRPRMTRGTWHRLAIGGAFAAVAASTAVVSLPPPMASEAQAAAAPLVPRLARGSATEIAKPPAEIVFEVAETRAPARVEAKRPAPAWRALPPPIPPVPAKLRVVQIPPKVVRPPDDASPDQLGAYADQLAKTGSTEAAIAASRHYLRVAPDGADAARMRTMLAQLEVAAR